MCSDEDGTDDGATLTRSKLVRQQLTVVSQKHQFVCNLTEQLHKPEESMPNF